MGKDLLRLDGQLCFAMYAACRAMDALYRRELAALGLTYPQYLVMLELWSRAADAGPNGEAAATVKQLGRALRLDSGTLSPLLKRLEAAGLVRRERDRHDERSVRVALTGQGHALRARAERVPARAHAASGLDAAEAEHLRRMLGRVTASLDLAVADADATTPAGPAA
ncbi:MarR family winged helix-turn-helix transcriptional regulator [Sphaerisporangium melleum]|uniref:MarR family transcriptional regulator n=1 Tax=Sphaerisporangium melleum TaxID=321316 RepID=A0A917VPQ2_9ACTN|nr:MarR family transcriptional regulator [Sphaerisporangium melleum]GGL02236.1 MarR family transcriptional regulator [Sphaerisporangium melleum]